MASAMGTVRTARQDDCRVYGMVHPEISFKDH
jgi:hypothetical protein